MLIIGNTGCGVYSNSVLSPKVFSEIALNNKVY